MLSSDAAALVENMTEERAGEKTCRLIEEGEKKKKKDSTEPIN